MALSDDYISRILKASRQRRATTGSPTPVNDVQGAFKGAIEASLGRQLEAERVGVLKGDLALRREQQANADRAAAVSGLAQIGTTGVMAAYLGRNQLGKLAGGIRDRFAAGTASSLAVPSVPAFDVAGASLNVPSSSLGFTGDFGLTAGEVAADAGIPTGIEAGAGSFLSTAGVYTPPIAAGLLGGKLGSLIGQGKQAEVIGGVAGGAAAGALAGSIFPGPGNAIGALIGGAVGGIQEATVICTEMYKQRYISYRVLMLDLEYRERYIDDYTYMGYMTWAPYVVRGMQKSKVFSYLVSSIAKKWALNAAHEIDNSIPTSITGKIIHRIGIPLCRTIGKFSGRVISWA